MITSRNFSRKNMLKRGLFLLISAASGVMVAATDLTLADTPLFLATRVQPNIYFIVDDSGSMNWETLYTKESQNVYGGRSYPNNGSGTSTIDRTPDISDWSNGLNGDNKNSIRNDVLRTCLGVNALHYNPSKKYSPWDGVDEDGDAYPNQLVTAADGDPWNETGIVDLTDEDGDGNKTGYFPWVDIDGDGLLDASVDANKNGQVDEWIDHNGNGEYDTYFDINGDGIITANEYESELECPDPRLLDDDLSTDQVKTVLSGWLIPVDGMTVTEQQNYANWYSYYRKRKWVSKKALAGIITSSTARMGINTIWDRSPLDVEDVDNLSTPVNATAVTNKRNLMDNMFAIGSNNGTPLRDALERAGEYFSDTNNGPILSQANGGSCQQNFAILLTDGVWNGDSPGVGNQDRNTTNAFDGGLYADGVSNTLADVAMKYYKGDLDPDLDDIVPVATPSDGQVHYDGNNAQHLVTYTVAFGVSGTLDDDVNPGDEDWPGWPTPSDNDTRTIDDVRHAAYNGRGLFLNAQDPDELINSLNDAIEDIQGKDATASAVSVNTGSISTSTLIFQAEFNSQKWNGQVNAIPLTLDGVVDKDSEVIASIVPSNLNRSIVTYDPVNNTGLAFSWGSLTPALQALVGSEDLLNYTRGSSALEGTTYRSRTLILVEDADGNDVVATGVESPLGDIVNSSPAYVGDPIFLYPDNLEATAYSDYRKNPDGNTANDFSIDGKVFRRTPMIYVGANDGMLHGFQVSPQNISGGREQFGLERIAYVPNATLPMLSDIADKSYGHAYSVDGSPYVGDAFFDSEWHSVLVGGFNSGGQGMFALDVTNPDSFGVEANAANSVLWEITDSSSADFADIGYTFGKPTIVKANNGRWVAIFGNGYNNEVADGNVGGGTPVLYIVDLEDGSLIRKLDTATNVLPTTNGLSAPNAIDENGDFKADAVYAGDLEGNMWKFDISSNIPANWNVAHSGAPLFTACSDATCTTDNRQPITAKPQVGRNKGANGFVVYFGTGSYILENDNHNVSQQTFYAIWDRDQTAFSAFTRDHLLQQEILEEKAVYDPISGVYIGEHRITTDYPVSWHTSSGLPTDGEDDDSLVDNHLGWYMDLVNIEGGNTDGYGERAVSDPQLRDDSIIFVTAIPDQDPCHYGGTGWYMEIQAASGAQPETPAIDVDGDGDVDEFDILMSDNLGANSSSGIRSDALATSPVCITLPNGEETCVSNTSAPDTLLQVERDAGLALGRWMWREL